MPSTSSVGPAFYRLRSGTSRRPRDRRATFTFYRPQSTFVVEVVFRHDRPAEVPAYLPMCERSSAHAVRFRAKNMVEAAAVMQFLGDNRSDLAPSATTG